MISRCTRQKEKFVLGFLNSLFKKGESCENRYRGMGSHLAPNEGGVGRDQKERAGIRTQIGSDSDPMDYQSLPLWNLWRKVPGWSLFLHRYAGSRPRGLLGAEAEE